MNRINSKLVLRALFWGVAAILAMNLGRLAYQGWKPLRARAAAAHSYTVIRTESGFDQAGTLKYMIQYIEAVRSDGSYVWKSTTPTVTQRKIYIANGDKILTNENIGKKTTYPHFFTGIPTPRDPASSCLPPQGNGWVVDCTENVGGFRAVRLVSAGSKRTMTAWYALDVGCALLKTRFQHETGLTVSNLTSLRPGEPDAGLFQVDANFQETPPSGLYAPVCLEDGRCTAPPPDNVRQNMDKNYAALRAKNQ
jgi:hypothetical protein